MPNPFGSNHNPKPVLASQDKGAFGAIAVAPQTLSGVARFLEKRAIAKSQLEIIRERVKASTDVQKAELAVVRDQAIAAVTTSAILKGINTRAAIVATEAAALGGLQTALVVQKASIGSELAGARLASAFENLSAHNERRDIVMQKFADGELDQTQADCMLQLVAGLHAQVEDAVDKSYEGGREVLNNGFELATKTAAEVAQKLNTI